MRSEEFIDYQLEEDWKKTAASVGTALAIGAGSYSANKRAEPETTAKPVQPAVYVTRTPVTKAPEVPKSAPATKILPQTPQEHQNFLKQQAEKFGITGAELTHFLAQASHETLGFKRMTERGTPEYFAKRYDKKHAPGRAKILGNTDAGDGERYRGRGYIQLTGKYNYDRAGRALGVDLLNNPELAAEPETAAKIAVWYWQKRVQPRVTDWGKATVKTVTKPINPAGKGMKSREQHLQKIKTGYVK